MRVRAPGKLMVAGEYAVLYGHAAWVMAVDRHAFVDDAAGEGAPAPVEVAAAFAIALRERHLDAVSARWALDVRALGDDHGRKLGLGSSAAGCVAALGWAFAKAGHDLGDPAVRARVADLARRGHRAAQGGGSGVDVLASAAGGVIEVALPEGPAGPAVVRPAEGFGEIPRAVLWSGSSARTSEMIARVEALRARDAGRCEARITAIAGAARALATAAAQGDRDGVVRAVAAHGAAMAALGADAGAPIVTAALGRLAAEIEPLGAAVKPSGAGGGDVSLLVAHDAAALAAAVARSRVLGFTPLALGLDRAGVGVVEEEKR